MANRIISKGYFNNYRTPADLKKEFPKYYDIIVKSYTPIIVPEDVSGTNGRTTVTIAEIDAWINISGFPGFELIYKTDWDPILTDKRFDGKNLVECVKSKGKRVCIFNEWPDNCQGTWNSPRKAYTNTLATDADRRGDFEFINKHGANFIVSDRSLVLWQFLNVSGKRKPD